MTKDLYESSVSKSGDVGAFFECDDETAYFYLFDVIESKVLDAIYVCNGADAADLGQDDIAIRWDVGEKKVGLFLKGNLWAVFDISLKEKYGGRYRSGGVPEIPHSASFAI